MPAWLPHVCFHADTKLCRAAGSSLQLPSQGKWEKSFAKRTANKKIKQFQKYTIFWCETFGRKRCNRLNSTHWVICLLCSALLTKIPKVPASRPWRRTEKQHLHRKIQYQTPSAQIALKPKSFSYKRAYIIEIITSFLKVINMQTVSKVGRGREGRTDQQAAGYEAGESWSIQTLCDLSYWIVLLN